MPSPAYYYYSIVKNNQGVVVRVVDKGEKGNNE
jgi:hypothetical protein